MSAGMSAESSPAETVAWGPAQWAGAVLLWLWVAVPFGFGLYALITRIPALFGA